MLSSKETKMKSFGTGFTITNDVYQPLDKKIFGCNSKGQPYIHLATVHRGLKEYCAYADIEANKMWVEEVDPTSPGLFKKISDNQEFYDLIAFLHEHRLLEIGSRREIKAGKEGLSVFGKIPYTV
jgi:hypothetical protein